MDGPRGRFTYAQYMTAIREAAKAYDKKRAKKNRMRSANVMEQSYDDNDDGEAELAAELSAYNINQVPGSRMSSEQWRSLGQEARKIWDSLDAKDKAIILSGGNKSSGSSDKSKARGRRSANVHFQEGTEEDSDDDDDDTPESEPELEANKTEMEANKAKKNAHPGDVRRVMGNKGDSTKKNPQRAGYKIQWDVNTIRRIPKDQQEPLPTLHQAGDDTVEDNELGQWGGDSSEADELAEESSGEPDSTKTETVDSSKHEAYMSEMASYWKEQESQDFRQGD